MSSTSPIAMSSQDQYPEYVQHLHAAERSLQSLAALRPDETRIAGWTSEIIAIKAAFATCLAETSSTNWSDIVEAGAEPLMSVATLIEGIDPTFGNTHDESKERLSELSVDQRTQWDVLESLSRAFETFGSLEDDLSDEASEANSAQRCDEGNLAGSLHDEEVIPPPKSRTINGAEMRETTRRELNRDVPSCLPSTWTRARRLYGR
jgi:hypothetical protein